MLNQVICLAVFLDNLQQQITVVVEDILTPTYDSGQSIVYFYCPLTARTLWCCSLACVQRDLISPGFGFWRLKSLESARATLIHLNVLIPNVEAAVLAAESSLMFHSSYFGRHRKRAMQVLTALGCACVEYTISIPSIYPHLLRYNSLFRGRALSRSAKHENSLRLSHILGHNLRTKCPL